MFGECPQVSYMEIYNEKVFDLLDLAGDQRAGLKVGVRGQVQMHQGLQGHREVIWNGWGSSSRFNLF